MWRRSVFPFLATVCFIAAGFAAGSAKADEDRMAGSVPVAASRAPSPKIETPKSPEKNHSDTNQKGAPHVRFAPSLREVESQGILSSSADGGLGKDVWRGSVRTEILSDITQMPPRAFYRTMQDLVHRLLLTQSDWGLLESRGDDTQPGNDYATLRLKKLLEMGDNKSAFKLYAKAPEDVAYPDSFITGGILAAFYSGQTPLACLDAKSVEISSQSLPFKQQIKEICNFFLSKTTGRPSTHAANADPESRNTTLSLIEKDKNYRFSPKNIDEIQHLALFDIIALLSDDRLDLKNLSLPSDPAVIPPHVTDVFINTPSLPEDSAFSLMVQAVIRGVKSPQDLEFWYLEKADSLFGKKRSETSLRAYREIKGWQRIPYIHRAAIHAAEGAAIDSIMAQAFALADEYGTVVLWPFASIIASLNPQNLSEENAQKGFKVLVETNQEIPPAWSDSWKVREKKFFSMKKREKMTYLAYGISLDTTTETDEELIDFSEFLSSLTPLQKEIIKISYEKLDKSKKFHNDNDNVAYENVTDLTSSSDYVMHNTGLLERLKKAGLDQRPGEVILLSSIALRDTPPAQLQPGLYSGVIDGLIAVGLTKEARSLAREVMLGMFEN